MNNYLMNKPIPIQIALVLFTLFGFSLAGYGQGFLRADGKKIVNEKGEEVILRGMGLGGWMLQEGYMLQISSVANPQHQIRAKVRELIGEQQTQAFYDAWLANHCRKVDIDSLAAWGFNSVRLPMHYNLFTLPVEQEPVAGQHTWLNKGFALTDSLLKWCKANRLYLILDLHGAPGGQGHDAAISDYESGKPSLWESEANQKKTVALWRKLAERYANEPWMGGYDLINEPNWGFQNAQDLNGCAETGNAPLRKLYTEITAAIREVDTRHLLFIEGNCWGNNHRGLFPLWDNNLVISYHKYWNYNDAASIQGMLATRDQYNVPLWLGETGENSNSWHRGAIELLEKNRIGWAWWPLKKLGLNCPLEVKVNPGYQKIMDYWNGKAAKPSESEAFAGLMQLTENLKLENTFYRRDYVDAMFRQVATATTAPFKKQTILSGKTILYAVDYDLGRVGSAYFDRDTADYHVVEGTYKAWNKGWSYRNDGVDIEACTDAPTNGYQVGWTEDGEWLQYTVNVAAAGTYDLKIRTASSGDEGKMTLFANGLPLTESISLPNTGGYQTWATTEVKNVYLLSGINRLRVNIDRGGFNFNYLEWNGPLTTSQVQPKLLSAQTQGTGESIELIFNQPFSPVPAGHGFTVKVNGEAAEISGVALKAGYAQVLSIRLAHPITYGDRVTVSYGGTAVTTTAGVALNAFTDAVVRLDLVNPLNQNRIPGKVEAENTAESQGISLEASTDMGGGQNLGHTDPGDFFTYRVNILQTGTYQIDYRTAGQSATGKINVYVVENSQATLLESREFAATGGWQTWKTTTGQEVTLTKGDKFIRVEVVQGSFNLNWLNFQLKSVPEGTPLQFINGNSNPDGTQLLLHFNQALSNQGIGSQGFRLLVDGQLKTVRSVRLNGSKGLLLELAEPVAPGVMLKLAYDGSGTLRSEQGAALEAFEYQLLTNMTVPQVPALPIPGKLEAEAFVVNNGFQLETTTDAGGGQNVGYTDAGDYLDFNVMVSEAGVYKVEYRVAGESAAGSLKLQLLENDTATDLHPALSFDATGGWQTWKTVSGEVTLPAGKHTLRFLALSAGFNFNWLQFTYLHNGLPLSTEDPVLASAVTLFPNPSSGAFTVDFGALPHRPERLIIRDLTGKKLWEAKPDPKVSYLRVNRTFARGFYLVLVVVKGKTVVKKLLIQ